MNGGTAPGWELDSEIICSSLNWFVFRELRCL